jgi:hypothetical protein
LDTVEERRQAGGLVALDGQHRDRLGLEQVAAFFPAQVRQVILGLQKLPQLAQLVRWASGVKGSFQRQCKAQALLVIGQQPQGHLALRVGVEIQQPTGVGDRRHWVFTGRACGLTAAVR